MISLLNNKALCPGTLTESVHRLISLLSDKNVKVLSGPSACINKNHTVFLPPLPKDATEKDFIKYFHLGTHEQAHIYGGSDFDRASKDKTHFKLENALEDVRCEQLQEKEYPGLKAYRIKFYEDCLEDFLNEEFINAESDNILKLIHALGKYIIVKARMVQLDAPHLNLTPSDSLLKAYYVHVSDLENRIVNMSTLDEMFELSGIIYDRLKDLIREDAEKKAQKKAQENKPQPQQEDQDDEDNEQTSDDDGEGESSTEGDTPEDSDGEPSEEEGDESEASDSKDAVDDGGSDGGDDGEKEEGNDQGDNDEPENDEPSGSGSDQGSNNEPDEDCPSSGDSDDETVNDVQGENEKDGKDVPDDSEELDIDPEEVEKEVQKVIDDLNNEEDSMDILTNITNEINDASKYDSPYMVSPHVKDDIHFGGETTEECAAIIRAVGMEMLGPKGSQLTKLFISQTKPRMQYNRRSGDLDVLSFATDVHDSRKDLYKNMTAAKLEKAAVTFLMDNSGSMDNNIGSTYAILSAILTLMSRACIPTEAIGYTISECYSDTWRDTPAILTIIKEFKENFTGKAMRRCTPPKYLGCTNDIDGIKFAVPRLWAQPEKKKVVMILCDGNTEMSNCELTRKAVQAYKEYIDICRKAGIIVFGIGINVDLYPVFGDDCASVDTSNVGEVLLTKLTAILNRR